jgi:hypothetical protein
MGVLWSNQCWTSKTNWSGAIELEEVNAAKQIIAKGGAEIVVVSLDRKVLFW